MKRNSDWSQGLTILAQSLCTTLLQLRIHRNVSECWGYAKLTQILTEHQTSVATALDSVIRRLLALEQAVDLQNLGRINVGQTVEELFVSEREMAVQTRALIQRLSTDLKSEVVTSRMLDEVLLSEDMRAAFFSQQLELVRQMGSQNYLAFRC